VFRLNFAPKGDSTLRFSAAKPSEAEETKTSDTRLPLTGHSFMARDGPRKMLKPNNYEDSASLVQMNPLNSIVSLKVQKQLSSLDEDEVQVKSLFEFHKESQFGTSEAFLAQIAQAKKPVFNFANSSQPLVLKPFFTTQAPLFKIPSFVTNAAAKIEETKVIEEEDAAAPTNEETVPAADATFEKLFQRQICRLKTLKGAPPSKKDNGFLSLERSREGSAYFVYRNFIGANQFSGVVSPTQSRVKLLNEKPGKFQVKVLVLQPSAGKSVHLMVSFITDSDRQGFLKVFTGLLSNAPDCDL
jgi:hypothetical protein